MPDAPFTDQATCELHFKNDSDIEDAGEFCKYLIDQVATGNAKRGDKIIWGLDVEYMSLVSTPAVGDSEFVKGCKTKGMKTKTNHEVEFLQSKRQGEAENHIVYAPALVPDIVDGNGEFLRKSDIFNASVKYAEKRKVDAEHDFGQSRGYPVHNWVLRQDETWTTPGGSSRAFPEGTWMVGIKVTDVDAWEKIQNGDITGFSIAGYWKAYEIKTNINNDSETNHTEVDIMDKDEFMKFMADYENMKADEQKKAEDTGKLDELIKSIADLKTEFDTRLKAIEDSTPVTDEKADDEEEEKPEDDEKKVEDPEEEEDPEKADAEVEDVSDEEEDKKTEEKEPEKKKLEEKMKLGNPDSGREVKFKTMDDMIANHSDYWKQKSAKKE